MSSLRKWKQAERTTSLIVGIDAAPDVVANGLQLLRQFEDTHPEIHFVLLAMCEGVRVDPSPVYVFKGSIYGV